MNVVTALEGAMDLRGLWPAQGRSAVIACSGGVDSTVLARLLAPRLIARGHGCLLACLDHGLRDGAADDVASVKALAAELRTGFASVRRRPDPNRAAAEGLQSAARAVRYGWLRELSDREGGAPIYLAHQRDDQVETLLLLAEQGVPSERAAGMSPARGRLRRPLLDVPRSSIEALAAERGWPFRIDPSNADLRFARSRIRHVVVPALRATDPAAERSLLQAGLRAGARRTYLLKESDAARPAVLLHASPGAATFDRPGLVRLDVEIALVLLRSSMNPDGRGPARRALLDVLADAERGGKARVRHLGAGWNARTAGDRVDLSRAPLKLEGLGPDAAPLVEDMPVRWGGRSIGCRRLDPVEAHEQLGEAGAGIDHALVDGGRAGSLSVEAAGTGRRMRPFGLGGSRSVRELLAEAGVPRDRRAGWPVVVDAAGEVLWLVGVRASELAPIRPESADSMLLYTSADRPDADRLEAG